MKLTIYGYSTALFSTWYFIEELGILFDAGDGLVSNLMGKSGKIRDIFISHADRDHITGLLQYNQLFAQHKPQIYYPKDSGSFRYLDTFFKQFDPHNTGTKWISIEDNSEIKCKQNIIVKAIENRHIEQQGFLKSLSYKVFTSKSKLNKEFIDLSKEELIRIKAEKGNDFITEKVLRNILTYSGDTPIYDYSAYDNCEILIHEATFLKASETNTKSNKNKHSSLEDVMKMIADIHIEKAILGHFSSRYDQKDIDNEIKRLIKYYNIKVPIYRVPIGHCIKDILNTNSLN